MSATAARSSDASECSDFKFEREFALRLFEAVGTPVAVGRAMLIRNSEYETACTLPVDPRCYQEPTHFAEDYQVAELLRKSLNLPGFPDSLREAKALAKFLSTEVYNAETNIRLWSTPQPDWFGEFSHQVLRILGPLDVKALTDVSELGKFGPGACIGVRSDELVPSKKYEANPVVTSGVLPILQGFIPDMVKDYKSNTMHKVQVVAGSHHFTVPKSFDIKRCAAKEPLWNSFIQLGIGRYIERRLTRFGVDLHDQRVNQALAENARDWELATIDLSSASDMMTRVLVTLSLVYNQDPQGVRWLHLLNSCRSPKMKIDGDWQTLEMFSSMGNGFTFPLETAIFLALIRATVPREDWCVCTAYGDDIIVPQRYAHQVVERLKYLGFKVNSKKTCLAGSFFESCGTDWFNGRNVRPFYLHRDPASPVPYPLQAANALRAWCLRIYGYLPLRFYPLWNWCRMGIPQAFRNPVPPGLGDVGLHVSVTQGVKLGVKTARSVIPFAEGYAVRYAKLRASKVDRMSFGVLASGLSSTSVGPPDNPVIRGTPVLGHLRKFAISHVRTTPGSASKGLEPVRGLYGRVRSETAVVLWEDDFNWV